MIVTLTIFSIISMVAVSVVANSLKSARKIQAQAFLYTEAQALMDKMAREVENSALDYEAYFSMDVLDQSWETPSYGQYAQSFYNPGSGGPFNEGPYEDVGGYGVYCEDGVNVYPTGADPETGEINGGTCFDDDPPRDAFDQNTGTHPFDGIDAFGYPSDDSFGMNARCDAGSTCGSVIYNVADALILINSAGDERSIYTRRDLEGNACTWDPANNGDCLLVKLAMKGNDTTSDGIVDSWTCQNNFVCEDPALPLLSDFKAMNPSALDVEEFYVYLVPTEDPYRAFAEEDAQVQPQVTLLLTVTLSEGYGANLLGNPPTITLQRTVSTGVYSEIKTYEP